MALVDQLLTSAIAGFIAQRVVAAWSRHSCAGAGRGGPEGEHEERDPELEAAIHELAELARSKSALHNARGPLR
jgi:hypothetical protein